jgi:hypothetical protein
MNETVKNGLKISFVVQQQGNNSLLLLKGGLSNI